MKQIALLAFALFWIALIQCQESYVLHNFVNASKLLTIHYEPLTLNANGTIRTVVIDGVTFIAVYPPA